MSIENLAQYFRTIEDPRCSGKVEHRLIDILVIAVSAVIACAESWDDIALYGRSKLAWLRTFLELPNGIPSHDTFRRVFMLKSLLTLALARPLRRRGDELALPDPEAAIGIGRGQHTLQLPPPYCAANLTRPRVVLIAIVDECIYPGSPVVM